MSMGSQNTGATGLLGELEYVLRTAPSVNSIHSCAPETYPWIGRAAAAIRSWNVLREVQFHADIKNIQKFGQASVVNSAYASMMVALHQASYDVRLQTIGPVSTAIGQGEVFEYFDEVRKLIQTASADILFIDPYLDADFVATYLTQIKPGVSVRLLMKKNPQALVAAVSKLHEQSGLQIEVRTIKDIHDRYVFIDRLSCYQSGASFKDGGNKAPTTLTQITDAFAAMLGTYEKLWAEASPVS